MTMNTAEPKQPPGTYTIHICPICKEQHEYDSEYGWGECRHEPYGMVEPVEVEVYVGANAIVAQREWYAGPAQVLLEDGIKRDVARLQWLGLKCEERVARRDPLKTPYWGPFIACWDTALLNRQFYGGDYSPPRRCPECHETSCEKVVGLPTAGSDKVDVDA